MEIELESIIGLEMGMKRNIADNWVIQKTKLTPLVLVDCSRFLFVAISKKS